MGKNVYNQMGYKSKDECYTTYIESLKIINYLIENQKINKNMIVWLPFDNELSNIYKVLKEKEFNITISNLEIGLDFYNYEPEKWDLIITNPPFSGRTNLMKRLMSFDKPFVILQATQFFNNQYAVNYLCDNSNHFQFVMPRTRTNFLTYNKDENIIKSSKNGASFYSFWLCYKINLPQTFNTLKDDGREKIVEKYDMQGNTIIDNQLNIFNIK